LLPGADFKTLRHQATAGQLGLPSGLLDPERAAGRRAKPAKPPPLFSRRL
jgi:hypothetical protein